MRNFVSPGALLDKLTGRLQRCRRLVLFLDYDGTLRPIAPRPQNALAGKPLSALLRRIEKTRGVTLAIVTGRPVRNIRKLLPLRNSWFVGTHGAEICRGFGRLKETIDTLKVRAAIRRMIHDLKPRIDADFTIEDKRISISVHDRLAEPARAAAVRRFLRRQVAPYAGEGILSVILGKGAMEIKPAAANKGLAVDAVLQGARGPDIFCIAMGDDRIDADLFRKVRQRGVSICVGAKLLPSDFRLAHPRQTIAFLKLLVRFWETKNQTSF